MSLKMPVTTPMSKDDPSDVKTEFIPLPPEHLWPELDNSASVSTASAPTPAPVQTPAPADRSPLQFLGGTRSKVIPLQGPFLLDGVEIREIEVRRLTLGEVENMLAAYQGKRLMTMDIFGVMTGLTAAIIRGLDDDDGIAVTEAGYDFLPLRLRPESEPSETSTPSEATSRA